VRLYKTKNECQVVNYSSGQLHHAIHFINLNPKANPRTWLHANSHPVPQLICARSHSSIEI
jgi:hypothetical protein